LGDKTIGRDGLATRGLGERCLDDTVIQLGRLGDNKNPCTPPSTTGMHIARLLYNLRISGHNLTLSHKTDRPCRTWSFCFKRFRHKWSRTPKMESIVCMFMPISHTCRGMTRLLSQLQPPQLRENLTCYQCPPDSLPGLRPWTPLEKSNSKLFTK